MKVKEVERILTNDGWVVLKQKGSHQQWVHPTKKGKVTLPRHKGDIPIGTLNSIFKQAGLK